MNRVIKNLVHIPSESLKVNELGGDKELLQKFFIKIRK